MVKKINAFNIQKVFVAFALIAFTLFSLGEMMYLHRQHQITT